MGHKSFFSVVRLLIPILLLLLFTVFLNKAIVLNPGAVRVWLDGFGVYAVVIYIITQTLSIVIAPIGGSSFALAILALFGPLEGTILIYLVTAPAYVINFLIARRYGKAVVYKFTGSQGEGLVKRFMTGITVRKLTFMKIFLGGYFDYISYGAGLSHISLTHFVLINIFAGIPSALFTWVVMKFTPNFISGVIVFYVFPVIIGILYLGVSRFTKSKVIETEELLEHEI